MSVTDGFYFLGCAGALWFFYTCAREAAEGHYKARERVALDLLAHDLGHVDGGDEYWHDKQCPHTMLDSTLDALVRGAEAPEVAQRWKDIYTFQRAKAAGWAAAAESDIEMSDVEQEFHCWQRQQGEAR